jgi:isopenicillin N synthase-like dioxygenase
MGVNLPVIDLGPYLKSGGKEGSEACSAIARSFQDVGIALVRDPRLPENLPRRFVGLMERYFGQPEEVKMVDCRAEIGYQVGWTPSFIERPRVRPEVVAKLAPDHQPKPVLTADPKERFFASLGTKPLTTKFEWLNAEPVMPRAFPEWYDVTGAWSTNMMATVHTLLEMAALGFGERADLFNGFLEYGPHLLAPTGSNLAKYGAPGTVLAGFHDDLNFVTAHTQSNFPGLRAWTRTGESFFPKVPDGCVLVQAGQQLEYVTGGAILCGLHEVLAVEPAQAKIRAEIADDRVPWRISSTLFAHATSDATLLPVGRFATDEAHAKYPGVLAGDKVMKELEAIELVRN